MRTGYVAVFAVLAALLLPSAARAQYFDCESYVYYDGNALSGYSRTVDYNMEYVVGVESTLYDPYHQQMDQNSDFPLYFTWAEADVREYPYQWDAWFSVEGQHWYWGDDWCQYGCWEELPGSYYPTYVESTPPPPPAQITVCPVPSPPWGSGSNSAVIGGSGFSGNTPQVSWSGNGGVNFLQSSSATVTSDTQINFSVSLAPVTSDGSITLGVGTAACVIPVLAAAQPTVSGPNTVWWFNGQTPSGYNTSITLTSSGGSTTTWNVTQGSSKVNLSGSGAQATVTSSGTAFSGDVGDIGITATANGQTSAVFSITSRKPVGLHHEVTQTLCNPAYGYETKIYYTIQDQLTATLPSAVPVNEAWTTEIIPDYTGTNWRRVSATEGGGMTESSTLFYDRIQGELAGYVPTATCDGNSTMVQHWGQQWRAGSTTSGDGVPVQTNTLQKYIGRADHL